MPSRVCCSFDPLEKAWESRQQPAAGMDVLCSDVGYTSSLAGTSIQRIRTAITLIISSKATCTTRTAIIATTMG